MSRFVTLASNETQLILACATGTRPEILHWGPRLDRYSDDDLVRMRRRQHAPGSCDQEVPASLLNAAGSGMAGPPGFAAHRAGKDWASQFDIVRVEQKNAASVEITCEDPTTQIAARHSLRLTPVSDILVCETEIENFGPELLNIDWCSVICLPIDPRMQRLISFTGRWAGEFMREEIERFSGSFVKENKAGRTSHDSFPGLLFLGQNTSEQDGVCVGLHLGWSGNHRLRVDQLSDGRVFSQAGENFWPGEMRLQPGARYATPRLYAGYSKNGLNGLSQKFHTHVRAEILAHRLAGKPRPVHFNTWEAIYFDHSPEQLARLVDKAAQLGAERFVLDDGWFGARRHDRAGLGDWFVSPEVYPDGLEPLISHVRRSGMEFGLWVEPEMVNPDSDLYRAHPDWVLAANGKAQISSRGQYVLDVSLPDVAAYLFERLDALLCDHEISYLKWDMNRDIHHPGSHGRAAAHLHVHYLYALIDRLRRKHPHLEIESCASGGGRADYGILQRTDRIWTSDNNDALERQGIQQGASYFFPPEVLGVHVGPKTCHITGRNLAMSLRVSTALMGHMGLELNLLQLAPEAERALRRGIALYKRHRALIHSGRLYRLDTDETVQAFGIVAQDQSTALFNWCNLASHKATLPGRFYPVGLSAERAYRVRIAWPENVRSISQPSVIEALDLADAGHVLSGDALMKFGLQVPLLQPETCLIYQFDTVAAPAQELESKSDN